MADLPDDVLRNIFSFLPQETIVQCRFVSRAVEPLARAFAFRSIHLDVNCAVGPFLSVVRSERLRPVVRELTLDFLQDLPTLRAGEVPYDVRLQKHRKILMAVPLVRFFSGLRALNVRFGREQNRGLQRLMVARGGTLGRGDLDTNCLSPTCIEALLKCISGSWTEESQAQWDERWNRWEGSRAEALSHLSLNTGNPADTESFGMTQHFPKTAINLSTLTVSNLSENDSEYLKASPVLQRFLATQSLSTMQLLTTGWDCNPAMPDSFPLHNRHIFLTNLPSTWLSPSISDRLRTLSLYSHDLWGWYPKMDFRLLGRGPNGTGGLPNLRTLALGKFVFSHQWQVDWIAQVGSENGRGGLQELYLDNCPIMWRGRVFGPVDSEGFPRAEVMTQELNHPGSWDPAIVDVDLRWASVLKEWRQKMRSLRVFRMGGGDWEGEFSADVAMAKTASQAWVVDGAYTMAKRRNEDTVHLNYDKYSVEDCHKHGQGIIRDGVGLCQKRQYLLQYIQFEQALGDSPWVERDFKEALKNEYEDGYQRYEAARLQDEDALKAFNAAIECRNGYRKEGVSN
ncbi:hypothetical protein diail_5282 [Diaporthe ilicicola]|nr:hypothetical protein diail_5282 [Diaporthe ilicicola]